MRVTVKHTFASRPCDQGALGPWSFIRRGGRGPPAALLGRGLVVGNSPGEHLLTHPYARAVTLLVGGHQRGSTDDGAGGVQVVA